MECSRLQYISPNVSLAHHVRSDVVHKSDNERSVKKINELYIYFYMYNFISLLFNDQVIFFYLIHSWAIPMPFCFGLYSSVGWFSKLVRYRGFMLRMFRRHYTCGAVSQEQIIPEFYL